MGCSCLFHSTTTVTLSFTELPLKTVRPSNFNINKCLQKRLSVVGLLFLPVTFFSSPHHYLQYKKKQITARIGMGRTELLTEKFTHTSLQTI